MIDQINIQFQNLRARIFWPILSVLNRLGISADAITNFRLFLGIIFIFWFRVNRLQGSIIVLIALFLDIFDGALARYQGNASDRGKFLDVLVDHFIYIFIVLTFFDLGISPIAVGLNIFIIPVVYLLATIKKEEFGKSDWIIKVYPRLSYLKAPTVAFFIYIFTGINSIYWTLTACNLLATLLTFYYFIFIQRRWLAR